MMKIKARKSEYQNCFDTPDQDHFKAIYEEQLAYRIKRREKEHCHYVMRWDSESLDEAYNAPTDKENESPGSLTERTTSTLTESMDGVVETNCSSSPHETVQSNPLTSVENSSIKNLNKKQKINVEKKKKNVPKLNILKDEERPPFLSYGWADKQVETGRKKSHNVHAPKKAVYPAALKRLNYLKVEKAKQKLKNEKRAAAASTVPFYQKPTDTSCWLSEYQRCFSRQSSRAAEASSNSNRDSKSRKGRRTPLYPSR